MPIGIQRLNVRHQPPTPHIIFIKPLPGPSSTIANEFLSRVAAICHPILKAHHLSIMSLEEFPANREFIGRNFNAGEVVQLVLRTHSGAWMSYRSVVMVMVHELAHCVQMNHSKAFWAVRNEYAEVMRGLWARGYTGEGVWGPGRQVMSGLQVGGQVVEEEMPEHICGGTYRSRRGGGRKRKREGSGMSYAERQQRRIARKFGVYGKPLGDDEETRVKLESGKKVQGKPRVAGSKRGRELRAQAALARFGGGGETMKEETGQNQLRFKQEEQLPVIKNEEDEDLESELESDYEEGGDVALEAVDFDGTILHDSEGRGMIKVCPDEDGDDVHVKKEMQELQDLDNIPLDANTKEPTRRKGESKPMRSISKPSPPASIERQAPLQEDERLAHVERELLPEEHYPTPMPKMHQDKHIMSIRDPTPELTCPTCSLSNPADALLCDCCANILRPSKAPGHWRCKSEQCKGSLFINSGDFGRCRICGGANEGA